MLLVVNLGGLLGTLAANREWRSFFAEFLELAALIEPVTLGSLALLILVSACLCDCPGGLASRLSFCRYYW